MFDFSDYTEALFVNRINRFVSEVEIEGVREKVYVPNTGRLSELAIPGNRVLLEKYSGKFRFKIKYIIHNDFPVMINSSHTNTLFEKLLKDKSVPEFETLETVKAEPKKGNHRFDFLVSDSKRDHCIEIKSCTLGYRNVASFPDAVSERASRHILALSSIDNSSLIFLVLLNDIAVFIPNYHTDFMFYETLKKSSESINIKAYAVIYDKKINITGLKEVPVLIPDLKPRGIYGIVLFNDSEREISVGSLGTVKFKRGYYIYTGSAKNNVFKRISHHRNKNKSRHYHMDYLKGKMKIISDIPVITDRFTECELAESVSSLSDGKVDLFGSSDCKCRSHLFYFKNNPVQSEDFWDMVLEYRFSQYT